MKYLEFYQQLKPFGVFSTLDIKKIYPRFDKRRLVEWQGKGYITKVKRAYYYFNDIEVNESFLYKIANKIYAPSYISMESALTYYGFIPEGVFITTSVTTMNTAKQETGLGRFTFQHLKPELFFAYQIVSMNDNRIKIAEPEKAILDYLYLRKVPDIETLQGLRFNIPQIKEKLDFSKIEAYCSLFGSRVLNQRVTYLKTMVNA